MNSTQQQCFLEAAKRLNFTAAAEALYISQPALSRNIAALEDELEVLLFVRRNNVLSLTPGGEIIYRWMTDSAASLRSAVDRAKRANSESRSELRLGFIKTELPSEYDIRAIEAFRKQHPHVELSITHYPALEIIRHLTEHSMDIAIMIGSAAYGDARLQYLETAKYRRCMAVSISHPLAGRERASLREFSGDTFASVYPSSSPTMSRMIRSVCGSVGFEPKLLELSDTEEQVSRVEAGAAVALVPGNHYGRSNPLLRLIELDEYFPVSLICVWDRLNTNPSIGEYIAIVKGLMN